MHACIILPLPSCQSPGLLPHPPLPPSPSPSPPASPGCEQAPSVVVVGSHVWVEDPEEAWVDAVVTAVEKKKVTVSYKGKETVIRLKHCHPRDEDAPSCGVDDMTKLSYLHEPGVLHNLFLRYSIDEIYTYTGSILIAINPFCALPHLYDEQMMEQYKGTRLGELSPHVFAIAEAAYRCTCCECNMCVTST
ncbi:unnamed protein product [Closterium sp. NIES-65]|nr:unnamed protein product [Closterium sp. NIES-65]